MAKRYINNDHRNRPAMTMPHPPPRRDKSPNNASEKQASLAIRINRAANELNPFLVILAVGLLILNLTFYLGMSVSQHSPTAAHAASYTAPAAVVSSAPQAGSAHN
ncbi:MAG: hypothetical protein WAV02_22290 [Stellaceae bacterium]